VLRCTRPLKKAQASKSMRNAQGHRQSSVLFINEMNADGKFLNTSEFVDKLNECLRSVFDDESEVSNRCDESSRQNGPCVPQFELRSRFSDGTTRLLDDTERAYADYKFKLGQVRLFLLFTTSIECNLRLLYHHLLFVIPFLFSGGSKHFSLTTS